MARHLEKVILHLERFPISERQIDQIEKAKSSGEYENLLDLIIGNDAYFEDFRELMMTNGDFSDYEVISIFFHRKNGPKLSEREVVEIMKHYDHLFAHAWLASKHIS